MSCQPDSYEFGSFGPVGGIMGGAYGTINLSLIFGGRGSSAINPAAHPVNQNNPISSHQIQGPFAQGQGPTMYNMRPPFPQHSQSNPCIIHVGDIAHGVWHYNQLTLLWSYSECELCQTYQHHISDAEYDQVPSFLEAYAQVSPLNKGEKQEQEVKDESIRLHSENA